MPVVTVICLQHFQTKHNCGGVAMQQGCSRKGSWGTQTSQLDHFTLSSYSKPSSYLVRRVGQVITRTVLLYYHQHEERGARIVGVRFQIVLSNGFSDRWLESKEIRMEEALKKHFQKAPRRGSLWVMPKSCSWHQLQRDLAFESWHRNTTLTSVWYF